MGTYWSADTSLGQYSLLEANFSATGVNFINILRSLFRTKVFLAAFL